MKNAAEELKAKIGKYSETYDISDDFKPGKLEKRFRIKDGAQSMGITMSDITRQIRQGFYGEDAVRIQRGKDDVKV